MSSQKCQTSLIFAYAVFLCALGAGATESDDLLKTCLSKTTSIENATASYQVRGILNKKWVVPVHPEVNREYRSEVTFGSSDGRLRLEERFLGEGEAKVPQIYICNPPLYYSVHKSNSGYYTLDRLGQETNISQKLRGTSGLFVFRSPFGYASKLSVSGLLRSPLFVLQKVARDKTNGEEVIRIDFTLKPSPDTHDLGLTGWLTISPAEGWCLKGYECNFLKKLPNQDLTIRGSIEYAGFDGVVPIPKRVKIVERYSPGNTTATIDFEVSDFKLKDLPEEYFSLSGFGLGDLARPSRSKYIYYIIFISVCIVLSLFFRWLAHRARVPSTSLS